MKYKRNYLKPEIEKFDTLRNITLCSCQPKQGGCPSDDSDPLICAYRDPPLEPPGPCSCVWKDNSWRD